MNERLKRNLFGISGILVALACVQSPVLLPYPLFVIATLRGWKLRFSAPPMVKLLLSTIVCTFVLETGAWAGSYLVDDPAPALMHPQWIPDLILAWGVYSAWWLTWGIALRRYQFTAGQVFWVTGLYGVLIEQQGKVFIAGLQSFPEGILLWLFVFIAYGATMALAVHLVRGAFEGDRTSWLKYPLVWAFLFIATLLTASIWGMILQWLNFLPPPRFPMKRFPLW